MNICSTCNEDSNNCLTCAPLRSLPNCDCDSGYYEAMETC